MSPGDDDSRCRDCDHHHTIRSDWGECRANPPVLGNVLMRSDDVVVRGEGGGWPDVLPTDWCGAWKPLED